MKIAGLIAFLLPLLLVGQVPVAKLDTAVIRIGEQATLQLSIELHTSAINVEWPAIGDTLQRYVEIVDPGKVDTVNKDGSIQLTRNIKITSFDTGYWAIAPLTFKIGDQKRSTDPLLVTVRPVELPSDPKLHDIKPIHDLPFNLISWVRRHWYWIAALVVLVIGILALIRWWKKRRTAVPATSAPGPVLPLHEQFLQELGHLEKERLWQKGLHKEYHSRLTDLLRQYIEERYHVPALERTTDELLHELRVTALDSDQRTSLRNMLRSSDLVKFAKALPSPAENEQMMTGAIRFINTTAQTQMPQHVQ